MSCIEFGVEQKWPAFGDGLKPVNPACRFPISDPRVSQSCGCHDAWIRTLLDHQRRREVSQPTLGIGRFDRITPFGPFWRCQWKISNEHGFEDIHKWHVSDDAFKQFWSPHDRGANQ